MAGFNALVGLHAEADFFGPFVVHFLGALLRFHHLGHALRQHGQDMRIFANARLRAVCPAPVASDGMVTWLDDVADMDAIFTPDARVHFIWNGATETALVEEIGRRGCRVVFCELGLFPQHATTFFDSEGVGAASAFFRHGACPNRDPAQSEALRALYLSSLARDDRPLDAPHAGQCYILVPLQMEADASVLIGSDYLDMDRLVGDVAGLFPDHLIVARPHPNAPGVALQPRCNVVIDTRAALGSLIEGAAAVVGINSTCLMEALFWHKPVVSLGANLAWNKRCFVAETRDIQALSASAILSAEVNAEAINGFISEVFLHRQINTRSFLDAGTLAAHAVFGELLPGLRPPA